MKNFFVALTTLIGASQAAYLRRKTTIYLGTCAESATRFCHRFASCNDLDGAGTFECVCNTGYEGDGRVCTDLNECLLEGDDYPCPPSELGGVCVDTNVHDENDEIAKYEGYKCMCNTLQGFIDGPESDVHGPKSCIDPTIPTNPPSPAPTKPPTTSLMPSSSFICEDNDDCTQFATCVQGQCNCDVGYEGDGRWNCQDTNECLRKGDDHPCPSAETGGFCVDTDVHDPDNEQYEGYRCGCDSNMGVVDGSESDVHGPTLCEDVNECDSNPCDENAVCINTFGSFQCECIEGFNGDGFSCSENPTSSPSTSPTFMMRCFGTDDEVIIYKEDFGNATAEGWDTDEIALTSDEFPDTFSEFLGPFSAEDSKPSIEISIPASVLSFLITFDFYEIDAWFDEDDSLGIIIEAPNEGIYTVIDFGSFNYTVEERERISSTSIDDDDGAYSWIVESIPIAASPQGSLSEFQDQMHHVEVTLGPSLYSNAGEDDLRVTMDFSLIGQNKSIGFDNFKWAACVDTVPSASPSYSSIPSIIPSMVPSAGPSRRPVQPPQPLPTGISGGATEFPTLAGDDDSEPPPIALPPIFLDFPAV